MTQQINVSKVSVRSKGYYPSQPRVPAGQDGGGRWTSTGGGSGTIAKLTSADQIRSISGPVYVRWSKSAELDASRGYSLAYGSQAEAGLSACEIDKSWDDWRIARQIQEYQFASGGEGKCWIVSGERVGTGGDNEPLLRNMRVIGQVSGELLSADYLKLWRDQALGEERSRLDRITDAVGKKITQELINKLENGSRETWQRIMYTGG